MKTIGEIISSARIAQNLTQDEVSQATKIDVKYIEALEKNRFDLLPPPTFTKGFIRNVARVLGKSPDDLIAIYRRDLPTTKKTPVNTSKPTSQPINKLALPARSTIVLVALGLFIFFGYLAFQYRALLIPPPLVVSTPQDKAVVNSPVGIAGQTSIDSLVTITPDRGSLDSQTDVKPDSVGAFNLELNLSPGEHQLTITTTNRYGRSTSRDLNITVISSD